MNSFMKVTGDSKMVTCLPKQLSNPLTRSHLWGWADQPNAFFKVKYSNNFEVKTIIRKIHMLNGKLFVFHLLLQINSVQCHFIAVLHSF
jgi:hypothetical protein